MFKLKVPKNKRNTIRKALKLVETPKYDYVLVMDKEDVEEGKINIVFNEEQLERVERVLDAVAKGEETYLTVYGELGQKSVDVQHIQYFIVEPDDVKAVLNQSTFTIRRKLYELEEMLVNKHFIRVSKYALVNINKIDYIRPALNSKLNLLMKNGDEVEVNRHYYKAFKKALQL